VATVPSSKDFNEMFGGAFLLHTASAATVFTPEDLTDDQRAIGRLVDEFWTRDVAPALPGLLRHEPGVGRSLLLRASTVGLTALHIPEEFGGPDLDLVSVLVAAEHLAEDASYSGWHMGHAGIGTLPIVWFGTDAQRRKYLPRLASADQMAAYALTEPGAGSDAMAITTRADLSADGRSYVLNGQKMWITGGGVADIFVTFAKVGGEHLTAFIVERDFGLKNGAEEKKMGLSGTSTTAVFFDDVKVPVENVLGTIGGGHRVAFSVLNAGRLLMGPLAIRGARRILETSIAYAQSRRAFGRAIAEYGAVREMIADAAIGLFAVEAATWRVAGLIEGRRLQLMETGLPSHAAAAAAFDEFAAECSIVKVAASEMLDAVADHGVQVHGGYGYHADYLVERAYRDARINRIFEGTNEINRTVISHLLLKRTAAQTETLAAAALTAVHSASDSSRGIDSKDTSTLVDRLRALTLILFGAGLLAHGDELRSHQHITLRLADAAIDTFLAESAALRAGRLSAANSASAESAHAMALIYARDALTRTARAAEDVVIATMGRDAARLTAALARIRELAAPEVLDVIGLTEAIARSIVGLSRASP
jgi:alkylation response protein AidB-like acyl-CoA dehydrogenase